MFTPGYFEIKLALKIINIAHLKLRSIFVKYVEMMFKRDY